MDTLKPMRRRSRQQGFSLVMTLIMLVIILLSSLGMMMAMRGGVSTAGNIAFRQAAVRSADVAGQEGLQWVSTQLGVDTTALNTTNTGANPGYYAIFNEADATCTTTTAFTPQSYDFANPACAMVHGSSVSGYTLYYVIHRMAAAAGSCPAAGCTGPLESANNNPGCSHDPDMPDYCGLASTRLHVYYRITIKVSGPRHNSRYIQTFVY